MSKTHDRAQRAIARNEERKAQIEKAKELKAKGMTNRAIAQEMFGTPTKDTTVRHLLK